MSDYIAVQNLEIDDSSAVIQSVNNDDIAVQNSVPIINYYNQESQGGTRTKGWIKITDYGDRIEVYVELRVRKSGVSGTGKGALGFELLDSSFNPILMIDKGLTVGARFPQGTHEKKWSKMYYLTGELAQKIKDKGAVFGGTISTVSDDIGLPANVTEWLEVVKDISPIIGLSTGQSVSIAPWLFTRL